MISLKEFKPYKLKCYKEVLGGKKVVSSGSYVSGVTQKNGCEDTQTTQTTSWDDGQCATTTTTQVCCPS